MPSEDFMSDDYVANLLAKDAKDSTIKYSALGLQAFLPKRPTTNAPKPNTRFLKTIIRETDSHNAALKAKEAEEARARLRRLHGVDGRPQDRRGAAHQTTKSEDGCLHQGRRSYEKDHRQTKRQRRSREGSPMQSSSRHIPRDQESRQDSRRHHAKGYSDEHDSHEDRKRRDRMHRHHSHRRRSLSPAATNRHSRKTRPRQRSRSHSPGLDQDHSHRKSRRRPRSSSLEPPKSKPNKRVKPATKKSSTSLPPPKSRPPDPPDSNPDPDSDPLDAIVGPAPPPKIRPRGRGRFASSTIDSHFSSAYDPSADIHPGSASEDDWDQALEALRDRQRWKQQGAERLRSAGFTEAEVSKWEKGGEKTTEDVRWREKGEGREWDRGKVLSDEGVETHAEWGRLKGT